MDIYQCGLFCRAVGRLRERDGKIYKVVEEALRRYLEKTDCNCTHEWQPLPRISLLSGGQDPTLGERFEEELYRY